MTTINIHITQLQNTIVIYRSQIIHWITSLNRFLLLVEYVKIKRINHQMLITNNFLGLEFKTEENFNGELIAFFNGGTICNFY